ncbi:DUF1064 domain-containing protein [Romboutsia maritimum]|uniref:DUF1064 domain-containing protein n=1 Tax=Romboutsia maritimum TaxID=2020948 RepID=A0A371IQ59_9FIRM|nr:DUF1064 domain-containing protein [Romboutsia maritimum]RDY22602.1 DUF1064 domain-containing protein [Romboutsia maritimum]
MIKYKNNKVTIDGITFDSKMEVIYYWGCTVEYIDVKGMETQQGVLRRKLFDYLNTNLPLREVTKSIKYGQDGWIDSDDLKKKRRDTKKLKANI